MKPKPLWLKWIFCLFPTFISLAMYFLLPFFQKFTEFVITRGLFRIVAFPLEWLMSFIPFSFTEAVVVLSIPAILGLIIIFVIRIIKSSEKLYTIERGCRFTAWCLSLALLIFMVMDGANFSRIPLSELLKLPNGTYTAQDLYTATCDIAKKANKARESLEEDQNGCSVLTVSIPELLSLADDCYDNLKEDYPFLITGVTRVKSAKLSRLWSYTGYTGVYCPWLAEASVNTDIPVFEIGHTAAHEIAHTMGFAKENECNFIAWLACSTSGQADYVYSGHLSAYVYCSNALYDADKELWKKSRVFCSEGMIRDLKYSISYWKQFEGEIKESSQKFNDSFIKVNGDESGVLSYDQMVELILRYYDKK